MLRDDLEFFRMIYDIFVHGTRQMYAAMGIGLLLAVLYFRIIFKDFSGFQEALAYTGGINNQISPQILFWIMISLGGGALAYYQLPEWFPHLFGK